MITTNREDERASTIGMQKDVLEGKRFNLEFARKTTIRTITMKMGEFLLNWPFDMTKPMSF
jgi:hypothetical protein